MKITQITIITALAILSTGCNQKSSTSDQNAPIDSLSLPDSEISGAVIRFFNGSILSTEIRAETIRKYESIDSTMAYIVDVDILDSAGQVTSRIVGDSGVIREQKRRIDIFGHVVVISSDSVRLETEYLYWNTISEKIETDAFVTITYGEDVHRGYGMEANEDLSSFKILNEVTGHIKVDKQKLK